MPRRDSDSDNGYRSRSHRKKTKKRSRRNSSSSSSRSSEIKSSSPEKSKHSSHRSGHSRNRSKHGHESSHKKKHRRRSRSSSGNSSGSYASQKRKHSSRSKQRSRRSSSRSSSHGRSSRSSKRSKSDERKSRSHKSSEISLKHPSREDAPVHEKLQAALKAAAVADAQLRQKGLLTGAALSSGGVTSQSSTNKSSELTVAQQLRRAQAIDEINSASFTQQEFTSSRSWGKKKSQPGSEDAENEVECLTLPHSQAETNGISGKTVEDWKDNPEKLIHPNLFEDPAAKMKRWKKKWIEMRQQRLEHVSS